jgi:alanine racemase
MTGDPSRARAVVDLDAIASNYRSVSAAGVPVMGVVKADAYGHGDRQVAQLLRSIGAEWLGVALPAEALTLRAAGDRGRLLAWLWAPGDPGLIDCIAADVDLSVSSDLGLVEVVNAAQRIGKPARVHMKVDTGLTRNGLPRESWKSVFSSAAAAQEAGLIEIVGVWSHLASADETENPANDEQARVFREACALLDDIGIRSLIRHLGNSAAALSRPDLALDVLRAGIAIYGLTPGAAMGTSRDLGLTPAMTLRARLAHVKTITPGTRVSYGGSWVAEQSTTVGLVPVGYADGIPRSASNRAEVLVGNRRCPVLGVIAMDQFVVDLGSTSSDQPGEEVVVFGSGASGEPTADDWAAWAGTIGYEIVTRVSARVPREYIGGGGE